ncbi:hypothetical protein [Mucilaginibacter gotjawali]|nr:hypothetical protein [Mucilaginibacter gotjawali]MBB3057670.1 hypothetical protein [Mucilaginibacter gotjawali]
MKRKLLYLLFFVAVFVCLSGGVMFLWNLILPQLTHLAKINYWQALGLTVLSRILFGRLFFGGLFGKYKGEGRADILKDKLMTMDEADKAAFKEEWRKRCGR